MYRFFALVFVFAGLVMFSFIVNDRLEHEGLVKTLTNPVIAALILFPFVPAVGLSWMASRVDKDTEKMVEAYNRKLKFEKSLLDDEPKKLGRWERPGEKKQENEWE